MTVTGAFLILSILPGLVTSSSEALAVPPLTKINLAGHEFADVGPSLASEYSSFSTSSATAFDSQCEWVRAEVNSCLVQGSLIIK